MNEIMEMIFQWHQGAGFKEIRRSMGLDRNTVRKYVDLPKRPGFNRGAPFSRKVKLREAQSDHGWLGFEEHAGTGPDRRPSGMDCRPFAR